MTSIQGIAQSELAQVAMRTWAGGRFAHLGAVDPADVSREDVAQYDAGLVQGLYHDHLMPNARARGARRRAADARAAGGAVDASVSPRQVLEYSSYLEGYLWPFCGPSVPFEHVMSMVIMVNEKAREGVPLWQAFHPPSPSSPSSASSTASSKFGSFLTRVLLLRAERALTLPEYSTLVAFLRHVFSSLEDDLVGPHALRLVSMPLWLGLTPTRLQLELAQTPQLAKPWARVAKTYAVLASAGGDGDVIRALLVERGLVQPAAGGGAAGGDAAGAAPAAEGSPLLPALAAAPPAAGGGSSATLLSRVQRRLEASFLPALINDLLALAEGVPPLHAAAGAGADDDEEEAAGDASASSSSFAVSPTRAVVAVCEQLAALLIELLSALPTRRFLRPLLSDRHVFLRLCRSGLARRSPYAALFYDAGVGLATPALAAAATSTGDAAAGAAAGGAAGGPLRRAAGVGASSPVSLSTGVISPGAAGGHTMAALAAQAAALAVGSGASAAAASGSGRWWCAPGQEGRLFTQQLAQMHSLLTFPVDDHTGAPRGEGQAAAAHYARLQLLQRLVHKHLASGAPDASGPASGFRKDMLEFALAPLASIASPPALLAYLRLLPATASLLGLAQRLRLLPVAEHMSVEPAAVAYARRLRLALTAPASASGASAVVKPVTAGGSSGAAVVPPRAAASGAASGAAVAGVKRPHPSTTSTTTGDDDDGDAADATGTGKAAAAPAAAAAASGAALQALAPVASDLLVPSVASAPVVPLPPLTRSFVTDVLLAAHAAPPSQHAAAAALPLHPTESLLWDTNVMPWAGGASASGGSATGGSASGLLPLPRLGLQYLSAYDYLLRAFTLYRLEAAYGVRSDIVDAVVRTAPRRVSGTDPRTGFLVNRTVFTGWARMALPVASFAVKDVEPPRVGETCPARVAAALTVDLSPYAAPIRAEWDGLREHDTLFMVSIVSRVPQGESPAGAWEIRRNALLAALKHAEEAAAAAARSSKRRRVGGAAGEEEDGSSSGSEEEEEEPPAADAAPAPSTGPRGGRTRGEDDADDPSFPLRHGVLFVRGCTLQAIEDDAGRPVGQFAQAAAAAGEGGGRRGVPSRPGPGGATGANTTPLGAGAAGSAGGGHPPVGVGLKRSYRVLLDAAQYHADMTALAKAKRGAGADAAAGGAADDWLRVDHDDTTASALAAGPYETVNLLVRRRGEENNAAAVLNTIRTLMGEAARDSTSAAAAAATSTAVGAATTPAPTTTSVLLPWLGEVFLGYGDPAAAHYSGATTLPATGTGTAGTGMSPYLDAALDWGDTFTSAAHLADAFPAHAGVTFIHEATGKTLAIDDPACRPPFRIAFVPVEPVADAGGGGSASADGGALVSFTRAVGASSAALAARMRVVAIAYTPTAPLRVASGADAAVATGNRVSFTPVQVEAIRSGLCHGLTLVVGPPGTGKTDTAVQTIVNLYRNFPTQRILLVTHSNQALNDLFAKIAVRGAIPDHHLLRLGAGEAELQAVVEGDYSKLGRVNHALARRLALLAEVDVVSRSIGVPMGDAGYTCETAAYFYSHHVATRIHGFRKALGLPQPPALAGESTAGALVPTGGSAAAAAEADAVGSGDGPGVGGYSSVVAAPSLLPAARAKYAALVDTATAHLSPQLVASLFPFAPYFGADWTTKAQGDGAAAVAGGGGATTAAAAGTATSGIVRAAEACFAHLTRLFTELESYRAYEILRSQRGRLDYSLTKQARVIAMTCTHAAIARAHLQSLGFTYDTLVMEEAGQVTDVETLIPMTLNAPAHTAILAGTAAAAAAAGSTAASASAAATSVGGVDVAGHPLKRIILIGDHNQLPPVIQNMPLAKQCGLDTSLFARLIRVGVPRVQLNAQGRARPAIARLYNWRYASSGGLGDLPLVSTAPEYAAANGGLARVAQLIDVPDYNGRGESTPLPHYFQNGGEAEYAVALFQYMRLCGYPADRITLLTTYNGQKQLLRDIVKRRCAPYAVFGSPAAIETVDKYQGQQNDYVILSLVRTKAVGHVRDVRRLVVALSRARLGLYVFGRAALFANCYELAPALSQLIEPPNALQLLLGESYGTTRPAAAPIEAVEAGSGGALRRVTVGGVEDMGRIVASILQAQTTMAAAMATMAASASAPAAAAAAAAGADAKPAATAAVGSAGTGAAGGDGGGDEDEEVRESVAAAAFEE